MHCIKALPASVLSFGLQQHARAGCSVVRMRHIQRHPRPTAHSTTDTQWTAQGLKRLLASQGQQAAMRLQSLSLQRPKPLMHTHSQEGHPAQEHGAAPGKLVLSGWKSIHCHVPTSMHWPSAPMLLACASTGQRRAGARGCREQSSGSGLSGAPEGDVTGAICSGGVDRGKPQAARPRITRGQPLPLQRGAWRARGLGGAALLAAAACACSIVCSYYNGVGGPCGIQALRFYASFNPGRLVPCLQPVR